MNNKKIVALLLAAMMSVSTASVAFADDTEIIKGYPDGDVWESKLYNAMLEAGDGLGGGSKDGKLTVDEAAAITSLDVTGLQSGALAGLEYCKGLTSLTVTDSQVKNLSFLSGLTSLTSLTLSGNEIEDLSGLPNSLQTLDLSDNASLADLSKLSGLSSLKTLDVSGTAVADVSKVPTSVTDLDISGTSVVDLSKLPTTNLESLKASGNGISDATAVASMTSLASLDLSNNPGLLISGIPDLTKLTGLNNLNLKGTGISAADEAALKAKLPGDLTNGDGWFEEIVGNPAPDAAEKGVLKSALDEAARLKAETFESENGKDVSSSLYWVKSEQMATFNSAVEKAQGVYDDPAAEKDAINQAVNDLNAAITTFKDTRQKGSAEADTSSLRTALAEARARKNEVKVSTDGSDIPTTEEWAPEAAHTEFQNAIAEAKGKLDGFSTNTTQQEVQEVINALNAAMNKFDQAAQSGTKPTTPTPNPDPTPSTSREYSDYYGNEKWDELKDKIAKLIEDGKEGETIEFNATGLPYFPASVARALKGEDITLKVRKNGVTYTINGLEIGTVHKIWYDFEDIESELLTADGAEDETSSSTGDKENPSTGR